MQSGNPLYGKAGRAAAEDKRPICRSRQLFHHKPRKIIRKNDHTMGAAGLFEKRIYRTVHGLSAAGDS